MPRDRRYYCVYIMGSLSGTLYLGVSGNLHKSVFQHKFHHFEGFTTGTTWHVCCMGVLQWCSQGSCAGDAAQRLEPCKEDCAHGASESALAGLSCRLVPMDACWR